MTSIVGLTIGGDVFMGADSQATAGYERTILAHSSPKVFKKEGVLFGVSGSMRAANHLEYTFQLPNPSRDQSDEMSYVVQIVDAMRASFKDAGIARVSETVESNGNDDGRSTILIGYRGRLFRVSSDWSILESDCPYQSIGSGSSYALGALHVLYAIKLESDPFVMIETALMAAAAFDIYTSAPFTFVGLSE